MAEPAKQLLGAIGLLVAGATMAPFAGHGGWRADREEVRERVNAAIRAGDLLAPEEIRALLAALDAIDLGAHCPHGRPVVRTVRYGEMAGWFDRT